MFAPHVRCSDEAGPQLRWRVHSVQLISATMSSSRIRSREVDEAHSGQRISQDRLQILLDRLRWSYAALWTLTPQTRVLEWQRGYYFQENTRAATARSSSHEPMKAWVAQQLYTTYRSCSFTPGTGFVGRANLEGRHIWLSGDSVCQNAGSLEQSQFLRSAKIKTVMCIPWLDSVLELGTTNFVGESFQLMDQIQQVLCRDLLSGPALHEDDHGAGLASPAAAGALHHQQAHSTVESLPLPSPALHKPGSGFQSPFDNLSDHVWRSDMYMQEQDSLPDPAGAWRAVASVGDSHTRHSNNAQQSTSRGLMITSSPARDQYGSCPNSFAGTGTATHGAPTSSASSVSSRGDQYSNSSSARPASSASPELLHQHIMDALSPPISRVSALDRASPAVRPPQGQLHLDSDAANNIKRLTLMHATAGARHQNCNLRRTTSCSDQYDIQKALSSLEEQGMQAQWRQRGLDPVSEAAHPNMDTDQPNGPFHTAWHQYGHDPTLNQTNSSKPRDDTLDMRSSNMNAVPRKQESPIPRGPLQRRHTLSAMEVLDEVQTYQQEAAADQANSYMINSYEHGYFQLQAGQVAPARPAHGQPMSTPNLRGRPRGTSSSRGSGVPAGHDEAAVNHMLAERRRRLKQKENFATLRRLVPIISKADKASTLVDAIVYLKDLQNTIVEMKANKDDMVQRCEDLASKCMELEEQNKELVAILFKDKPLSSSL